MPVMIYPPCTPNSPLFHRSKTLRLHPKFVAIIEVVTEKESGWDDDDFYDACKTIYMNPYPKLGNLV
jgi:hypothetical protein